jgi:cytidylate kinase
MQASSLSSPVAPGATKSFVIAVDGPSASGKGTLAKALAHHFGLRHLDTGGLYRAVGWSVLLQGGNPADPTAATAAASTLDLSLLGDAALRSEAAGSAASQAAAIPAVRQALLHFQRNFASYPPGAVLDGRDIGTVICPDADVKLYVTASLEERARRRVDELASRGITQSYARVFADLEARDVRDSTRVVAPLRPASDALLLDTSNLDKEAALAQAIRLVENKRQFGKT